jgi:hypothetical protein
MAEGERQVARAQRAVDGAMAQGRDPAPEQAALRMLELIQAAQVRECDRLRAALKRLTHWNG